MTALDALAERQARLARHCREGYALARREPAYRAIVLARLRAGSEGPPEDLWTAIPWIWTVALGGGEPDAGAMAAAVIEAAAILRAWLGGNDPVEALQARWSAATEQLALGSTLRSHPFADLRAWSIRPPSAA